MGLAHSIFRQFSHPRGRLGSLVGYLMAHSNREINGWTVSVLNIGAGDRVLEIGCGPGVGLAEALRRANKGFVAAIDPSEVMIRQASQRNTCYSNNSATGQAKPGITSPPSSVSCSERTTLSRAERKTTTSRVSG